MLWSMAGTKPIAVVTGASRGIGRAIVKASKQVVQPLGWAKPRGFANGILAEGRLLFVAGQVGWNAQLPSPKFPKGFAEQFERALLNVLTVVREAGGRPTDLVRLTLYVTDKKEYLSAAKQLGEIWKRHLGRHYPAITLVEVSGLLEDAAKLEIEATAML